MFHPLQAMPAGLRVRVLLVLGSLAVAMLVALIVAGADLRTTQAPLGIVSLELSGDAADAAAIIQSWKDLHAAAPPVNSVGGVVQAVPAGADRAALSLTLADFVFIFFYATSLTMACVWLGEASRWPLPGIALGWLVPVAAICDAAENLFLLRMLGGDLSDPAPAVTRVCATLKFTIVFLALAYLVAVWATRRK